MAEEERVKMGRIGRFRKRTAFLVFVCGKWD